jgi:TatD DNase family protein
LDLHPDPRAIVAECESRHIRVLSLTTTPRAWLGTKSLVKDHDLIFTALGIHPQLSINSQLELDLFQKLLPQTRFVGEIGIDGSKEFNPRITEQIHVFRSILEMCEEQQGCVLSIHSRNATAMVLDEIDNSVRNSVPILHWFSGNERELDRAISQNCWFSVGPPMFYSAKGMQLIRRMPPDRILTETDSPFVKFKGKQLMPWDIKIHMKQFSNLLGIDSHESARLIEDNCDKLIQNIL